MNITDLISAAQERAMESKRAALSTEAKANELALTRMEQLTALLAGQVDAIQALPATVMMTPTAITVTVPKNGCDLKIEAMFDAEFGKVYSLSWSANTLRTFDDGTQKALKAADAVNLMAEMIGRHLAGLRPVA